ncbi:DUF4013 domain-containing protein [Stieleria marina]|uniref:DUF4013 domain-containing protein n=1 Tax=Stieleria marina TaxID=1930275 RepID=A0A517P2Z9_9BACT|nr:hypothetical protein K239x_57630 [Planctomycetes bacterium K23_9]
MDDSQLDSAGAALSIGEPASLDSEIVVATAVPAREPLSTIEEKPRSRVRRWFGGVMWFVRGTFCVASLTALLAVLTAIPVLQLITFGYLLDVAGRLTRGGQFRDALPNLRRAGMIGLAVLAVFVASLPTQLLVHWESVAQLINPGSAQAVVLRFLAIVCSFVATMYLLWAWVRGGRPRHYLWPQPKRFLKESWRWATWRDIPDRLWEFTIALELPRLFWLGARGAVGTLVWLIPGMIIIAANRSGEGGLAGLIGGLSLLVMGVTLLYLPMLQAHFAAENRLSAMFELRTIRRNFVAAPWAWFAAMLLGLVVLPVPLYLLKVEATPREVAWLPCVVFVAFILPARIFEGLALRRARRRMGESSIDKNGNPLASRKKWARISRISVRILMLAVVGTYLVFLTISQFTSWDGLPTWVEQHAILFPRPFIGGV